MAFLLHIESAAKNCSVSIAKDGKILALVEEVSEDYSHAEKLPLFINYALEGAKIKLKELDGLCVDKGPGSYTGLRIGVSVAKGLCFGLNIPLITLDSLSILAQPISKEKAYFIAMLDARRKEVYTCIFDETKKRLTPIEALVLEENSFDKYPENQTYILGDSSIKASQILKKNFHYLDSLYPSSRDMVKLAHQLFEEKKFEKIDFFEPFYLKDFVSSTYI